jgi:hypothetical protein
MTPARNDLPPIGARIAARHHNGQWWHGPYTVVTSVSSTGVIELHPEWRPTNVHVVYTPTQEQPRPLRWAMWDALTDEEREATENPDKPQRATAARAATQILPSVP